MNCKNKRKYKEKEGVFVFDEKLDESFSTYDSIHLDELAKSEGFHFWFSSRSSLICKIFKRKIPKSSRILEIGGGTGFIAEKLNALGYSIELSDIASNGLRYAKNRGIKTLYQFDLFNPPFLHEFDVICLFDVLEHLKDDRKALDVIKSMLRPGGKIILTVPAHQWLWSQDDVIAGHKRRYTKKMLKSLFLSCNLCSVYVKYFFIFVFPFLALCKLFKKGNKKNMASGYVDLKIPRFVNRVFYILTRFEIFSFNYIPNLIGGSLIAIAQDCKKSYRYK